MDCPIHRNSMHYWPAGDLYACQLVDCKYGSGVRAEVVVFSTIGSGIGSDTVHEMRGRDQMTEQNRAWLGRNVHAMADPITNPRKPIGIALSEGSAEELRSYLSKLSLGFIVADPSVGELLTALNYVLKGDPESTNTKRAMDASKGMTPDGG